MTDTEIAITDTLFLENLSDEELLKLYNDYEKKVILLETENDLFESHLARVNLSTSKYDGENNETTKSDTTQKDGGNQKNERSKKKKNDKTKESESTITLTPEQKAEVSIREVEELKDEIDKEIEKWERIIDGYKAEIEEIDGRNTELKKTTIEFKKEVLQMRNARTGKLIAERVVKYIEDQLKLKETFIEKTRLKNSTLKVQKQKLQTQLRQKEEMGEVLHAIDFDQLKIENQQYLSKIEERNNELLKLKMQAGNIAQILAKYKKELSRLMDKNSSIQNDISQRTDLIQKLEIETNQVMDARDQASKLNKHLKQQMEDFKVPEVLEYVVEKALANYLAHKMKSWQRKVDVASMTLKKEKNVLKKMMEEDLMLQKKSKQNTELV